MATIVSHTPSGKKFVFLGTGFGAFQSSRPGILFGNLAPANNQGEYTMAAVCTKEGKILWCESSELQVVEVDGQNPSELLSS